MLDNVCRICLFAKVTYPGYGLQTLDTEIANISPVFPIFIFSKATQYNNKNLDGINCFWLWSQDVQS